VHLRIVPLSHVTEADLQRWSALAQQAAEPNPNADPAFLHTSAQNGVGADSLQLAIVESGDRFLLVMPFSVEERLSGRRLRHISTRGAFMHEFASKNHALLAPGEGDGAIETMLAGLRSFGLPDLVDLTVVPVGGPFYSALRRLGEAGRFPVVERGRDTRVHAVRADLGEPEGEHWYAREGDLFSFPMAHLSPRTRRNMGKYGRQIERTAGGPLELAEVGSGDILEEFLDLQAAGWKGAEHETGPRFRARGLEEWFRAVVQAFEGRGDLRALRLSANGATVYLAIAFRSGSGHFGFHDVYDERFVKSSPGAVGRVAQLGHELASPSAPSFDPGMEPYYTQANSLYPSRREYAHLFAGGGSARSRVVAAALPAAKRLRERLQAARGA